MMKKNLNYIFLKKSSTNFKIKKINKNNNKLLLNNNNNNNNKFYNNNRYNYKNQFLVQNLI
jgi:hypothetical protein